MIVQTTASRLQRGDRFDFAGNVAIATGEGDQRRIVVRAGGTSIIMDLPSDLMMTVERVGEFERGEKVLATAKELARLTGSHTAFEGRTDEDRQELLLTADIAFRLAEQAAG